MKWARRHFDALIMGFAFSIFTSVAWPLAASDVGGLEKKLREGASLSDLLTYVHKANPSIRAARESWKASIERYRAAVAYPEPMLLATYFPEPIETRLGPQDWNLNLTQTIPFPGKLSQAGEVIEADIQVARLELDKTLRDVMVKVRESYHELFYIQDAKRVTALNRNLLEHIRKVGETAYAQDRTVLFDVFKAQSQSAQLEYDALLLEDLGQTEKAQLNSLLNRQPDAEIKLVDGQPLPPVVYKLEEIYQLAARYQEEIQIAETRINKSRARIGLAKYEYLPEFRLGLFYAGIGHPDVPVQPRDAGRDAIGVQFGISIPLWFDKYDGRVQEARAEERRARAMKTALINAAHAQIRSLYFRLQNSERLVRLYRDQLIPQASQSMEIAETWFREKQGSFTDFIETQAVFYNFQLSLARAKADYGKFLALLERQTGRSLTNRVGEKEEKARGEGAR